MKTRAFNLMKQWCDRLLDFEVRSESKLLDGGLICPACHVIHGRCADLCYPLVTIFAKTGDSRYLEAADRLVSFTEASLRRPDGSYRNDAGSTWKGITAFGAMAIGDSLLEFGDKLPTELCERWTTIFRRLSDFCESFFDKIPSNINYRAGVSAELALAYRVFGDEKYRTKANKWEAYCRDFFDANGLLYGEIQPVTHVAENGSHGIDFGYDIEESLPLLLRHAVLLEDEEKIAFCKARFLDHLEFFLPDGAIDNSAGTRHNKWTYWGSRTSDGIIEGLALVLDDPIFAKACDRALTLYENCTHDGLLSMPMAHEFGEPTCLHHSFCHAKALAALVNSKVEIANFSDAQLPRELERGVLEFQSGNLLTVSVGGWRATASATGVCYLPGSENYGGSMTLLWHESVGAILASTMHQYKPIEPLNMQYLRSSDSSPCMTQRIEYDGYSSDCDAKVALSHGNDGVVATAEHWSAAWKFTEGKVVARFTCDRPARLILPLVCSKSVKAELTERRFTAGVLRVISSEPISGDASSRVFNQVGGFGYVPLEIAFDGELTVEISVG